MRLELALDFVDELRVQVEESPHEAGHEQQVLLAMRELVRALLVIDAGSEAEIRRRLADDPWASTGQLVITSIEPWQILVGAQRLSRGRCHRRDPRVNAACAPVGGSAGERPVADELG